MEPLFIVVELSKDTSLKIMDRTNALHVARQFAELFAKNSPGTEFMVFECKGSCVQEPVWKPVEQKSTRDIGIYSPGTK